VSHWRSGDVALIHRDSQVKLVKLRGANRGVDGDGALTRGTEQLRAGRTSTDVDYRAPCGSMDGTAFAFMPEKEGARSKCIWTFYCTTLITGRCVVPEQEGQSTCWVTRKRNGDFSSKACPGIVRPETVPITAETQRRSGS
jgi:hypothetical protein